MLRWQSLSCTGHSASLWGWNRDKGATEIALFVIDATQDLMSSFLCDVLSENFRKDRVGCAANAVSGTSWSRPLFLWL